HFTGKMPFQTVYIHGLVRDENNKKMSKTSNNGIDPLLLINKYGTDALRYTLVKEVAGAGQDIRMEYNRKTDESATVEASRNFTNKLWNASRFVLMNLAGATLVAEPTLPPVEQLEFADRWIISRFYQVTQQTRNYIENFGLGEAAKGLYEFIWGDFCDWYIELVKSRLQGTDSQSKAVAQQTLVFVLEGTLKLLHPFMPHITEEIWHTITQTGDDRCLAVEAYPEVKSNLIDPDLEHQFNLLFDTIRTIRNLRAEAEIKPGVKIQTILQSESDRERQILTDGQTYICDLAKVERLTISAETSETTESSQMVAGVVGTIQVLIPLAGVVDLEALRTKLERDLAKIEAEVNSLSTRLNNPNFVNKAPADVVQTAQATLEEAKKQAEILQARLAKL
ncbi:MAG TPA: class I tRNA ligase family protein, partial [Microcoleaceae cyanobacterium]